MTRFVLTLQCPDRPGIVNRVTGALLEVGGNITESAQFGDPDTNVFALRTVFDSDEETAQIASTLGRAASELAGKLTVRPLARWRRALIMVSRLDHCLLDLLFRHRNGELAIVLRNVSADFTVPTVSSRNASCHRMSRP